MAKIAILGSGGFGCALAIMCANENHDVRLWSCFEEEIQTLKQEREHKKLLAGVKIPQSVQMTSDLACASDADLVILAVPSFAVRSTAAKLKGVLAPHTIVANVGKGLEQGTLKRLSQVIYEELPEHVNVTISGPSHAEEVGRGMSTVVVAASKDIKAATYVQDTLMNPNFRIYINDDVIGVELGGALKNVMALAAGVLDGLKMGDNAKAALMTRGIAEMARLGVAMGGRTETFAGLSGIGDLIVTCTSMHSRNRRAGILIGEGTKAADAVKQIGTVEGYTAAKCAWELAERANIEMPIVEQVYEVLFREKSPKLAMAELMDRKKRHETEDIWFYQK